MLSLILNDGTEIELADMTQTDDLIVKCQNKAALMAIWEKMTPENLSRVVVRRDNEVIVVMENLMLLGVQSVINPDFTITAHFYYRGSTVESEYERAAKILLGEEE